MDNTNENRHSPEQPIPEEQAATDMPVLDELPPESTPPAVQESSSPEEQSAEMPPVIDSEDWLSTLLDIEILKEDLSTDVQADLADSNELDLEKILAEDWDAIAADESIPAAETQEIPDNTPPAAVSDETVVFSALTILVSAPAGFKSVFNSA